MRGVVQPLAAMPSTDVRHSFGRVVVVHGDAHHLRPGACEGSDLLDGALDVGRVGVRHRLHHDRSIGADAHTSNGNCHGITANDGRHESLKIKFTKAAGRPGLAQSEPKRTALREQRPQRAGRRYTCNMAR